MLDAIPRAADLREEIGWAVRPRFDLDEWLLPPREALSAIHAGRGCSSNRH
jgi:hypothetical protein